MARNETTPVKAVRTNFRIIEALGELDGAGVTEVARRVDMAKSSVHDHLQTLVDCGYVEKEDRTYRLAPGFIELGGRARRGTPLYRAAKPEVDDLAERTRTCAAVTAELRGSAVVIAESNRADVADVVGLDRSAPLSETAPGRVLLAHLSDDRAESSADAGDSAGDRRPVGERERRREALRRVRRAGVVHDEGEAGVDHVAVPIKDAEGSVCGALSVSGPAGRVRSQSPSERPREEHRRGSIGAMRPPEHGKEAAAGEDDDYQFPWKGSIRSPPRAQSGETAAVDEKLLAAMRRTASAIESRLKRR